MSLWPRVVRSTVSVRPFMHRARRLVERGDVSHCLRERTLLVSQYTDQVMTHEVLLQIVIERG